MKTVSVGRRKFSAGYQHLSLTFVSILVTLIALPHMTIQDIILCILAFRPAGWGMLLFLKSESPAVRSATFSVLRSFNKKTLATAILGHFQGKDPAGHSLMCDAVLLFWKRFPDSWTTLNVKKPVISRFWSFIKEWAL